MPSEAPIRLSEVTYRVERATLVRGLSFEVGKAETVVLLGRSGSGKTTALRLVNHVLMPTAGEVVVEGRRTAAERAALEDVLLALGETTFDVYLKGNAFWRNVPAAPFSHLRIGRCPDADQEPLHGESLVSIEDGSVWSSRTAGVSADSSCDALTSDSGRRTQLEHFQR